MKALLLGDVEGALGLELLRELLPPLRETYGLGQVLAVVDVASFEGGADFPALLAAGVEALFLAGFGGGEGQERGGKDRWGKERLREALEGLSVQRPQNFPDDWPGSGLCAFGPLRYLYLSDLDVAPEGSRDPERVLEETLALEGPPLVVIHHGGNLRRLRCLARRFDGRVAAVMGSGLHVATRDPVRLEGGTFSLSDLGVTGAAGGVCGAWPGAGEPALAGAILHLDPDGTIQEVLGQLWARADVVAAPGRWDAEGLYRAVKRGGAATDEEGLFDVVTRLTDRCLQSKSFCVGWRAAGGEPRHFISRDVFPDDHPILCDWLDRRLDEDELILSPRRDVHLAERDWAAVAEWREEEGEEEEEEEGKRKRKRRKEPAALRLVLLLARPTRLRLDPVRRELLQEIHGLLAMNLLRLHREEQLRVQVREVSSLLEIARTMATTIDLDELLGRIMELCADLLQVEMASVLLRDESRDELLFPLVTAEGKVPSKRLRFPADQGVAGWVLRHRKAQIVNDPDADPRALHLPEGPEGFVTRNLMCAPLLLQGRGIGVLEVLNRKDGRSFGERDLRLLEAIANQAVRPIENARLYENIRSITLSTVEALASAIDAKDRYTLGHSRRVTEYARALGRAIDLRDDQMEELTFVGLLHDIGKIAVDDRILNKAGALTVEERDKINIHPSRGAEILEHVAFLEEKVPGVKHHHERWDGGGYPDGLKEEQIPLYAQLISIADAFDAMTSDRPYRSGMAADEARSRVLAGSGTQFAPRFVALFDAIFETEFLPILRLHRQRDGVLMEQGGRR